MTQDLNESMALHGIPLHFISRTTSNPSALDAINKV